jgi:uncharacterized protein (DUF1697 family)
MPTYISLIRGINVGGHKKVKMDQLRTAVEALGFERVRTYVQSGNVVFQAPRQSVAAISRKIEGVIVAEFGHTTAVITKTSEEIARVLESNPFLNQAAVDLTRLYVVFFSGSPDLLDVKKLASIPSGDDQFRCHDDILFLYLPNGAGESKLANAPFEKLLSVRSTARNWRTINNLHEMALDRG